MKMRLTEQEQAFLNGESGRALQTALRHQVDVGAFFGARRLVPVSNAHVMCDWELMGQGGYDYLADLASDGAVVSIPTSRNARPVDLKYAERLRQDKALVAGERRVTNLLRQMGVTTVDTCIGYQSVYQPALGEHVAWSDTGAVIYANAVFGARSNYEAGPASVAAALTGRTPEYGFHLTMNRQPTSRWRVEFRPDDLADWGALGAVVGMGAPGYSSVPLIECLEPPSSPDALKHLGAALASYGSMAMFHLPGATPEALTLDGSSLEHEYTITRDDLTQMYGSPGSIGERVDLVVFTAPQLSLFELRRLAALLDGQRVADGVALLLTTNAMTRFAANESGYIDQIEASGGLVLQGTCWYLMDPARMRREFGWRRLVTNSAKLVNIIKAHGYEPILRSTEACVQSALTGKVTAL